MAMDRLTIGKAAEQGGINLQTIRYYERQGLLPEPPRHNSGYRMLSIDAVKRLRFIKRAQDLGFSLKEIKELLALRIRPSVSFFVSVTLALDVFPTVSHRIGSAPRAFGERWQSPLLIGPSRSSSIPL